jgi:hypothetical protein
MRKMLMFVVFPLAFAAGVGAAVHAYYSPVPTRSMAYSLGSCTWR